MVDYEILERMTEGSNRAPPPKMSDLKYAVVVCALQFGPLFLLLALVWIAGKVL